MKNLITGGAGSIGSAVVRLAAARGDEIVNLDALTYAACLDNVEEAAAATRYASEHADMPDCRAVVDRDLSGFLCEARSADSLAAAMRRFLVLPHATRSVMGGRGAPRWSAHSTKRSWCVPIATLFPPRPRQVELVETCNSRAARMPGLLTQSAGRCVTWAWALVVEIAPGTQPWASKARRAA